MLEVTLLYKVAIVYVYLHYPLLVTNVLQLKRNLQTYRPNIPSLHLVYTVVTFQFGVTQYNSLLYGWSKCAAVIG